MQLLKAFLNLKAMSNINNLRELRAEITRLKKVSEEQKQQLRNDVKEIGEALKPSSLLFSFLSSVTGIRLDKNEFIKGGIAYGVSLLIQGFVLKTEIGHKVLEWIESVLNRVKDFINRFTSASEKKEEKKEPS